MKLPAELRGMLDAADSAKEAVAITKESVKTVQELNELVKELNQNIIVLTKLLEQNTIELSKR